MEPLVLPGVLESLGKVRKYVKEASAVANLDKKATYRLSLAIDEIVTNIITHGYDEVGLDGVLELRADVEADRLVVTVEDTGAIYDPFKGVADSELDAPLEDRRIGGLGVYLTIQSVDQFHYQRVGNGRNRHTFVMNRANDQ
jgi:serine/threonine-protein kinase RsbW